jgi:hypothetical protein
LQNLEFRLHQKNFFPSTCTSKIGEKSLSQKCFVFGLPWHAEFGSEKFKKNHFTYPIREKVEFLRIQCGKRFLTNSQIDGQIF